jgi:hypothetical protein
VNFSISARTSHKDNIVLGDDYSLSRAEHGQVGSLQSLAEVLTDESSTGGDGDVLHGVPAVITETR